MKEKLIANISLGLDDFTWEIYKFIKKKKKKSYYLLFSNYSKKLKRVEHTQMHSKRPQLP